MNNDPNYLHLYTENDKHLVAGCPKAVYMQRHSQATQEEPLKLAGLTPLSFYSHFIFLLLLSLGHVHSPLPSPCSPSPILILFLLPHVLLHLLPCLTKQGNAV